MTRWSISPAGLLLLVHVALIPVYGVFRGNSVGHAMVEAVPQGRVFMRRE